MVGNIKSRVELLGIKQDIRQMAASMVREDGQIDKSDVKDLMRRAVADGHLDKKCAKDLVWVRERYADKFTAAALDVMNSVVGAFVEDEVKRMKEHERSRKIERHVAEIEHRIDLLKLDKKLRAMDVDTKQRFMITNMFGQQKRRTLGATDPGRSDE